MKTRMRLLGVASAAFFLFVGGLAAQSLASYVRTDKPEAVIDIAPGNKVRSGFLERCTGSIRKTSATRFTGAWRPSFWRTPAWRTTTPARQVMSTRFADRAFVESLNEGLPLPWQALRNVGKRYESIFGPGRLIPIAIST